MFSIEFTRADGHNYSFIVDTYGYGVWDGTDGKTLWYKNV